MGFVAFIIVFLVVSFVGLNLWNKILDPNKIPKVFKILSRYPKNVVSFVVTVLIIAIISAIFPNNIISGFFSGLMNSLFVYCLNQSYGNSF